MERTPDNPDRRGASQTPPPGTGATPEARATLVDQLNRQARSMRYVDYDRQRGFAESAFEAACTRDGTGNVYAYGMAAALSMLADRACNLGDWEQSRRLVSQALGLLDASKPSIALVDALEVDAWTSFYTGDYVDALDKIERALTAAEALGDLALQARALDRLANIHASAAHPDVAFEAHERALALLEQVDEPLLDAIIHNNLAYTLTDIGRLDEALASAEASLAYCETHHCPYLHTGVLDTLASVHTARGELDLASEFCRRGIDLARRCACDPDLANSLLSLSRAATLQGDWKVALDAARQALAVAETRGMGVEEYQCHELMSQIYEQTGDLSEALHHYRRFHQLQQARVNEEAASRLAVLRIEHQVQAARKDAEIQRLRALALAQEVEERRIAQAEAEAKASLDALTGLFNRQHVPVLDQRLAASIESGHSAAVALFDIDRFKQLNDTFGHVVGDHVLRAVAVQLARSARRSDVVCRYGGDEFLVLFTDMDVEEARQAIERVREAVEATTVAHGGGRVSVTLSGGLAGIGPGESADLDTLIERADAALYRAKRGGRNQLVVSEV